MRLVFRGKNEKIVKRISSGNESKEIFLMNRFRFIETTSPFFFLKFSKKKRLGLTAMSSILFNQSNKKLQETQTLLERLELFPSLELWTQAKATFDHLQRAVADLEDLAKRQVTQEKREIQLSRVSKMKSQLLEMSQRLELVQARLKSANDKSTSVENDNNIRNRQNLKDQSLQQDDTILFMDKFEQQSSRIANSGNRIEEFIQFGRTALEELHEQRSTLKVKKAFF